MRAKVFTVCVALAISSSVWAVNAPSIGGAEVDKSDDERISTSYFVGDLPLWNADGDAANPKVLLALVGLTVDVDLPAGAEATRVGFHAATNSLIVTGTEANHDKLKALLERLRAE